MLCLLAVTLCAKASAQTAPQTLTEDVAVLEQLPDGRGFIVRINGIEMRAVTAERWRELLTAEIKAQSADALDKLINEQKAQLINYIAALEKRGALDQDQIAKLTQLVSDCQAQTAARGKPGKLGIVKDVLNAGWQIFLWTRAAN